MKKTLLILALALWSMRLGAANINLAWNQSAGATSYRIYTSIGTAAFTPLMDLTGNTASVPVSINGMTRFNVTALNSVGESGPSNTVTNNPPPVPPTGPVITMVAPGLSTTNISVGQSVNITALIQNTGDADFVAVDGALTLLPPGANRDDGPYIHVTVVVPPLVVGAKASVAVTGTWMSAAGNAPGIYTAYLVVKSSTGIWTASPYSYFTVTASPTPSVPSAPTGLRVTAVSQNRLDVAWNPQLATVLIERSRDGNSYAQVASAAGDGFFPDTNLRRDTRYYYRTRSQNVAGTSGYSGTTTGKTLRR